MELNYNETTFKWCVSDEDRNSWENGEDIFYNLPKDKRPDFNFYEYFQNVSHQCVYKLDDIARSFPLNKCPQELVEGIYNLHALANMFEEYSRHVLGIALKAKNPELLEGGE